MLFEIAIIFAFLAGGVYWLWLRRKKKRKWNPSKQEPGEQWTIVEFRRYARGYVYLCQSQDDGHWIVHEVPSDDATVRSKIVRHGSEKEARAAFRQVV
jgi:hypothetical protein